MCTSRVVVGRDDFSVRILKAFPVLRENIEAFMDSLCFSSPKYVSKYDLDIFTRLFWPWSHLVQVWTSLVGHPGYQKNGTFNTTIEALNEHRMTPGSYVFRISMSCNGYWSIGYVASDGKIVQVLCFGLPMIDYLYYGKQQGLYDYHFVHAETRRDDYTH
ncbi:unnamed protein product [Mesocestoides corti]|uniref:E3 ubiquitin-protein ligase CBL n=1 Tax=Mesocestoides corti TaxID=53468 RepID=A0A0R3U7H7_MESCO|nr:unnamed protein product [Mesocestoides corti]